MNHASLTPETKNVRGRNEYMREYMAKRRPPSQKQLAEKRAAGLRAILAKLDGNDKALAVELRKLAEEALL